MSFETPSRAQIALALIVLKSKPSEFSTEEYICQIRSVIRNRARRIPVDAQNYIDGTLFWKQAYEKSEDENSKLLDKIYELERNTEANCDPLPIPSVGDDERSKANVTNKANTHNKRRKVDIKSGVENSGGLLQRPCATVSPACRLLMRAIFAIQANLKDNDASTSSLCSSIKFACLSMAQSLEDIYRARQASSLESSVLLVDQLRGILVELWTYILEAVRRCEDVDSDSTHKCRPEMVHLFSRMLGQIQQLCLDGADQQLKSRKKRSKASSVSSNNTKIDEAIAVYKKFCSATSTAFCQMLDTFDLHLVSHRAAFEGVLCALLDHIGSSMSLLIFAEPGINMQKQAGILPPRGLLDVAHIDSETAILTSQLAAPYLVLMMQKALSIADRMNDRDLAILLGLRTTSARRSDSLISKFKERLQNTLLRGVYGDEDTTFVHVLNRADGPDGTNLEKLLESLSINNDKSEWFIGQVWEHLGWDILCTDQA